MIEGVLLHGDPVNIFIEGNKIAKIEPAGGGAIDAVSGDAGGSGSGSTHGVVGESDQKGGTVVIDGRGKVALPGLINMHTHAAMTLMRGIGEDLPLHEWLESKIWPTEQKLREELVYWGTKLANVEMLKSGTTTFNDQYWHVGAAVKATKEMGLRSFHSYVILDLGDSSRWDELKEGAYQMWEASKEWGELNSFAVGLHAPYSVSEEMLVWGSNFAKERDLMLHIHLSETEKENLDSIKKHGVSPTKYLDRLSILDPNVVAAHSLWLDEEDIEILAKRGVKVVHNPNSNLKLGSGYRFKYNELRDAGVVVTLGSDGTASSNNLDLLEAMKIAALLQKGWRRDATVLPLEELLGIATLNGAKALRRDIGEIKEGMLADIVLVDIENYAFTPNINFLANLIYSTNSSAVETVICNGKVVMEGRKVEGEEEIIENVNRLYRELM